MTTAGWILGSIAAILTIARFLGLKPGYVSRLGRRAWRVAVASWVNVAGAFGDFLVGRYPRVERLMLAANTSVIIIVVGLGVGAPLLKSSVWPSPQVPYKKLNATATGDFGRCAQGLYADVRISWTIMNFGTSPIAEFPFIATRDGVTFKDLPEEMRKSDVVCEGQSLPEEPSGTQKSGDRWRISYPVESIAPGASRFCSVRTRPRCDGYDLNGTDYFGFYNEAYTDVVTIELSLPRHMSDFQFELQVRSTPDKEGRTLRRIDAHKDPENEGAVLLIARIEDLEPDQFYVLVWKKPPKLR